MFRPLLVVASTAFAQTDYSKFDQQRQIDDQQMKIDHLHSELQQQEFRAEGDAIIAAQQNRATHQADQSQHQSQKSAAELDEEARKSAGNEPCRLGSAQAARFNFESNIKRAK